MGCSDPADGLYANWRVRGGDGRYLRPVVRVFDGGSAAVRLGPLERYGEILSGALIAGVGVAFLDLASHLRPLGGVAGFFLRWAF
jgi:hypothetical protein